MKATTLIIFVAIFVLAIQFIPTEAQFYGYYYPYAAYGWGYGYGKREAGFDSNAFDSFHARNLRAANGY